MVWRLTAHGLEVSQTALISQIIQKELFRISTMSTDIFVLITPLCTHTRCEKLEDFKVLQTHGNQILCKIITLSRNKSVKQNQPCKVEIFPRNALGFQLS